MRVLASFIQIKVVEKLCTKTVLRKHALHGVPDKICRFLREYLGRSAETLTSRITRMTDIDPVCHLLAGEPYLACIDDDDVVTTIHVRSEVRLVLAPEDKRYPGSKTTEDQVSCIDDNPLFVHCSRIG